MMLENGKLDLCNEIIELLWENDCVILPNLGALIARTSEAALNPYSHIIKPKSKSIFFNPNITQTDGLLANHIADKYGIGYPNASKMVEESIAYIKNTITKGQKIKWDGLGEFVGAQDKTFFIPAKDINFLPETFGLLPIALEPIAEKAVEKPIEVEKEVTKEKITEPTLKVVAAPVSAMTPEHEQPLPVQEKSKLLPRIAKWAVAASILAFLTFVGIQNQDKTYYTHQEAAIIPDILSNGQVIDNETIAPIEETIETYNYEETPIEPLNETTISVEETSASMEVPEIPAQQEVSTEKATPKVATTEMYVQPIAYDINNRYHIVVGKTNITSQIETLLEKSKTTNFEPYLLQINNSKLFRIAVFGSNDLAETENQLSIIKPNFDKAEILDKKLYNHL